MPLRFNASMNNVVPSHLVGEGKERGWQPAHHEVAVLPGEGHEFSDEEIKAGLGVEWVEDDPRAGLPAEREFKRGRDAKHATPTDAPAESGDNEGDQP